MVSSPARAVVAIRANVAAATSAIRPFNHAPFIDESPCSWSDFSAGKHPAPAGPCQAQSCFVLSTLSSEWMWRPDLLTDIAAAALKSHAEALAAEQAVRGLDALAETGFHPILAAGYAAAGFGVFREQPYPGQPMKRPRHMERERCDLALTDRQGGVLGGPGAPGE